MAVQLSATSTKASQALAEAFASDDATQVEEAIEGLRLSILDDVMDAETWVSPETAVEWGLATEIRTSDEGEGVTQSARQLVCNTLTGASQGSAYHGLTFGFDTAELASTIAEQFPRLLAPAYPEPGTDPDPEPTQAQ
jgi:hypothetical protein